MPTGKSQIAQQLEAVQTLMRDCLRDTKISRFVPAKNNIMGSGKMLRAQLTLRLAAANRVDRKVRTHAAAAVEIIHGASLLHDDVIDGGVLRRGAKTFWKKHGTNGAILLGDLLVFKALDLIIRTERPDLLGELIHLSMEVCRSEVEQELVLRGTPGSWKECEQIARAKTGSLFAFAALAATDGSKVQTDALREAGFLVGTAYQLADDILDASANEVVAGKTLGKDTERGKTTAITATRNAPKNPVQYIHKLCGDSALLLEPWPRLVAAWDRFMEETMLPVLDRHLSAG